MTTLEHADLSRLIHDWNDQDGEWKPDWHVELDDETLRDGLQNPSVTDPELDDKRRILHLMDKLGIDTAAVGLPGSRFRRDFPNPNVPPPSRSRG